MDRWMECVRDDFCSSSGTWTAVTDAMDADRSLRRSLNSSSRVIFVHDDIDDTSSGVVLTLTVSIPRALRIVG
eukprot:CAMPEP_0194389006 /NCGR_PEP_ID=MMETSP0174-20130528/101563_1 /TAXON_ID=216777 /ORGANISM="Proboscia alata, Strain PI-D3" /LENGTH=72 /DNA_ID=CAMNT_0039180839 /DNA_START=112 /DNA_END=326 /DNA_ORIENTATION=-